VVATAGIVSAVDGQLYLAAIAFNPDGPFPSVTGVSGLGLVWTEVLSQCSGRSQTGVVVFQAQGSPSGFDGVVTATFSGTTDNAVIAVSRYSGASAIGNTQSANTNGVGGAAACGGGADSAAYAFNLTTGVNNAIVYVAAAMRFRSHTPGAGYTERAELIQGTGSSGKKASVAVQDQTVGSPATVLVDGTFSGSGNVDWAVVAVEIRP